MPLPIRKTETKDEFIAKCIAKLATEYPDIKQRTAICYQQAKK